MQFNARHYMLFFLFSFSLSIAAQNVNVSSIQLDGNLSLDGLLVTPDGTLYGTEGFDGTRLFKIEMDGSTSVVAGGLNGPIDLDYDADGNLFLSTFNNKGLYKLMPGNPFDVSLFATVTTGPSGVVVNRSTGNIYVSHYGAGFPGNGNSIWQVTPNGTSTVFAQGNGLQVPVSLAIDEAGNLYAPNIANARLYKITPNGNVSLLAQLPTAPIHPFNIGHIAYANGHLYVTGNSSQPLVFKVSLNGDFETIAGDGTIGYQDGPGLEAKFNAPNGIAASVTGDTLFISELNQPGIIRVIDLNSFNASDEASGSQYGLLQNFPNPVQSITTIEFQIGSSEQVHLAIFNSNGQMLDTLLNEHLPAGKHSVEWKTRHLPNGNYYYRLKAGKYIAQKKAVVVN